MERQRIVSALNLVLIGIICGAFGSFGTHTIYEIVPSEYFSQHQRYLIGAFVACCVSSAIVWKTYCQMTKCLIGKQFRAD